MTDEHIAALKRALDSVRNAREALRSIGVAPWWPMKGMVLLELGGAEKLLSAAIDEESKK